MKGGVRHVKGFHLRGSVDIAGNNLHDRRVDGAVVDFRVLGPIPQTDGKGFRPALSHKSNFVLKAFQFSQHGDHLLFKRLRQLSDTVALQTHIHTACEHLVSLMQDTTI